MGAAPRPPQRVPAAAWYVLAVLTVVYLLNFLDRTLIYILFIPIKAEVKFTDFQLAVLGPASFVIFYTLLGVPFGRPADRASRKKMSAAGLAVWSLFSGLIAVFMLLGLSLVWLGPAAADVHDVAGPRCGAWASAPTSSPSTSLPTASARPSSAASRPARRRQEPRHDELRAPRLPRRLPPRRAPPPARLTQDERTAVGFSISDFGFTSDG